MGRITKNATSTASADLLYKDWWRPGHLTWQWKQFRFVKRRKDKGAAGKGNICASGSITSSIASHRNNNGCCSKGWVKITLRQPADLFGLSSHRPACGLSLTSTTGIVTAVINFIAPSCRRKKSRQLTAEMQWSFRAALSRSFPIIMISAQWILTDTWWTDRYPNQTQLQCREFSFHVNSMNVNDIFAL